MDEAEEEFKFKLKQLLLDKQLKQIGETIRCSVCEKIPRSGPVPVCSNGHLVCKDCKREACLTCGIPMGERRFLLDVTVMENIEQHIFAGFYLPISVANLARGLGPYCDARAEMGRSRG